MSVRGVLIRSDSLESLTDFPVDLPSSPRPPRSPHLHAGRIDYFDRSLRGKGSVYRDGYKKRVGDGVNAENLGDLMFMYCQSSLSSGTIKFR